MRTESIRAAALRYTVAQARAYLQQLDISLGELSEMHAADLSGLLEAVRNARTAAEAINAIGTPLLRQEP